MGAPPLDRKGRKTARAPRRQSGETAAVPPRPRPVLDPEAVLAQAHFFRGLPQASRRALAAIAIPRSARKGRVLFREGDRGHSVHLLVRGRVELSRMTPGGGKAVITVIRPGEAFAEIVLFEADRYPVTACALTESLLFLLPRREIRGLLSGEGFRNDFLAMLFAKQRHLTERILQMARGRSVEERLLAFLRDQYGDAPVIRAEITKRAAAAAIGTTPESLSRLLKRLSREGRLTWSRETIRRRAPAGGRPAVRPS